MRRVVLPAEHGGWAFLGEPMLLGLLVAPSAAGALLALAAVAAFLTRQPLRLWAGDRRRGRSYPRTVLAARVLAVLAALGLAATAGALGLARGPAWLALVPAGALGAVAIAADLSLRSREALAEIAGALALTFLATAIALAGSWTTAPAFALAAALAARFVPTILFVRARLRLDRGERPSFAPSWIAHGLAVAGMGALAGRELLPWAAVAVTGLLLLRAAYGLSPWRPRLRTAMLGVTEIAFGLVVVLALAFGR